MYQRQFTFVALMATVALFMSLGCGSDDAGSNDVSGDGPPLYGTVTLEEAEDFSGVEVSAGDEAVTTEEDGFYEFESLAAGELEVTASHPDFESQTEEVEIVEGESVVLDFELLLPHEPPVIESISVVPNVLEPGAIGELEVVAYSPSDAALEFAWDAPQGWEIEPVDEATVELTAPNDIDQEASVEVVVEDEFGGQATDSVTVSTSEGSAPVITDISVEPTQVAPGEESMLEVEAHDPDGTELSYEWSVSSEWTVVDPDEAITALVAPDEFGVQAEVEIEVTDEYGLTASTQQTVSTIDNEGPEIESLSADPSEVLRGGIIDLEVVATHPQDVALTYDWSAPSEWTLIEDPDVPTMPELEAPDEPGVTGSVDVVVTDSEGKEATSSVLVKTSENQSPTIDSLNATPAAAIPGDTQTVEAVASDPDGFELDYDWDVPTGWEGTSADDELVLTAPDEYDASGTVTLTVDDGFATTSATVSVSTVQAVDPSISSLTASDEVVNRQGTSTLEVTASHDYDEELYYDWSVDNGDWTLSESGETAELTAPDISSSSVTATVEVTDGHGGSAEQSVTVETSPNSDPEIASFEADPEVVDRQGTSTLTVDATDPDGEDLSYDWSMDNSGWTISESGDTAELTAPDESESSVTVTVEVDDGYGGSATSNVTVSTAANQPPVISGFEADPEVVERQGTSTLTVDASDPDGEALSYDWSTDNSDWLLSESGETAELTAPDAPASSITVTVEVDDGYGGSATSEVTVSTVANQAPVISDLSIDPEDWVEQDGTAMATVTAVDDDGDAISYDWSISGDWDIDASVGDDHEAQLGAPDANDNAAVVTVEATDEWGATVTETADVRTQDTEPDAFSFDDQSDVDPNATITSNAVTVTGFDGPLSADCMDCEVSVNGGSFATSVGDVFDGDTIEIRRDSGDLSATVTATVTIGATDSDTWTLASAEWQGERTFSNCNRTGRTGPSQGQCDVNYSGSSLDGEVSVSNGIQTWTVPYTGTYRIEVMGARGVSPDDGRSGGSGARMRGDFDLQEGQELKILVGQEGLVAYNQDGLGGGGGGGGGSFVTLSDNSPLIIAGGGGGTRHSVEHDGCDGRTSEYGGTGSVTELSHDCGEKSTDLSEGGNTSASSWGSGGGGLNGSGEDDTILAADFGEGGTSFVGGGQGGQGLGCTEIDGGFGGGGSGSGCPGGGGGGGYSGGDGGGLAGGGGSYNDGTNQDNASGANAGHGQVSIDLVD